MSKAIANPLQSIIAQASQSLPATTGAVAPYRKRQARLESGKGTVILADISASMEEYAWGGNTKFQLLQSAVRTLRHMADHLVAFSQKGIVCPGELPAPHGNTNLADGIKVAASMHPSRILVISDGEPDNERAALDQAGHYSGVIDVLYIGPDGNKSAIEFLRKLAKSADGYYQSCDVAQENHARRLQHEMSRMLCLPGAVA